MYVLYVRSARVAPPWYLWYHFGTGQDAQRYWPSIVAKMKKHVSYMPLCLAHLANTQETLIFLNTACEIQKKFAADAAFRPLAMGYMYVFNV